MKYKYKCEICGKETTKHVGKKYNVPRFCSKKCANIKSLDIAHKIQFSWKNATEIQKMIKIKQNFYRDVIIRNGCWDWNKKTEKDGYTRVEVGERKKMQAHKISYLIHKGEIPKGKFVLHSCHNRKCCNPDHLHLGTHKNNMEEMVNANRQCKGSIHHNAKLTENEVVKIKKMLQNDNVVVREIAAKFNVTEQCIHLIKKNKTWKHV